MQLNKFVVKESSADEVTKFLIQPFTAIQFLADFFSSFDTYIILEKTTILRNS